MLPIIYLFFLCAFVAEFYCFFLAIDITKSLRPVLQKSLFWGYIMVTLLTWYAVWSFRYTYSGFLASTQVKGFLVAWFIGVLLGKIFAALLLFIDDIRRLIQYAFKNISKPKGSSEAVSPIGRATFIKQLAVVVAGLSVGSLLAGRGNRYKYNVKNITIRLPRLPASFRGLKIVQISDLHTGSFDNPEKVAHGIDLVLQQKPDLILFTGDLVNDYAKEVKEEYQEIYARLSAPMGVYSILGNHDYGDYGWFRTEAEKEKNFEAIVALHPKMGWKLLKNEHVLLQKGDDKIALIGIENWGARGGHSKYGDMQKATEGLENQKYLLKILMSHDPSHWDAQVRTDYPDIDLTLSGHTHGMQYGIDSQVLKWSPIQYLYKQWCGLYQAGSQYLYVNTGFGYIGYAGRVGILPEITVIELA
ncbi:MAG: metallophosphoesterase [Chitinophagia bacterium]|nr:metallophosphoesterase [Chitinophagia bacterium]